MTIESKPCPFCGEMPLVRQLDKGQVMVTCVNDHCMQIDGQAPMGYITHNWNTRPIEDWYLAKIADLEAKLLEAAHNAMSQASKLQDRIAQLEAKQ